eukprot:Hpha_TRINITY_DN22055_c0_g1::TRINITY_DN22055_c0_g1_i1::g.112171::m.112171/K17914/KIF13; kinesin family member 13
MASPGSPGRTGRTSRAPPALSVTTGKEKRARGVSFGSPSNSPRPGGQVTIEEESPGGSPMASPTPAWSPTVGSPARAGRRRSSFAPCLSPMVPEEAGDQTVKVMLRVRPFNAREQKIHEEKSDSYLRSIVEMPKGMDAGAINFLERDRHQEDEYHCSEVFQFDKAFWSIPIEDHPYNFQFCSQQIVFENLGMPALRNAWSGFNTCIFAYGQTGAGKTFTMMGPFTYEIGGDDIQGQPGVIPRLCKELYQGIEKKQREQEVDNPLRRIKVSFETELCAYEIYNERVRDLFYSHTPGREPGEELKVRTHPIDGPFVNKISKLTPKTWQECLGNIEEGNERRTVGATAMNADSSRSHSVFQIKFTQIETSIPKDKFEKPVHSSRYSVINLIDLAGSERNKKSQAAGGRLVEAANINLSLTTLKMVIDTLVHNSQHRQNPKPVPYRDSKLTMLLSHSLGGNSKTMMVACVSPHYDNQEETLSTLRYASAARKIVNVVKANEDSQARQNLILKEQLEQLEQILKDQNELAPGEASEEEMAELRDKIKVGHEQLLERQEDLRKAEEEAERLQRQKQDEQNKRYQAAFQHSFQMVILKRQKDEAQGVAQEHTEDLRDRADAAKRARESLEVVGTQVEELRKAAALRQAEVDEYSRRLKAEMQREQQEREKVLKKAYGQVYVERQRRHEAAKSHEQMLKDTIAQAARKHKELSDRHLERRYAYEAKLKVCDDDVARLSETLHKDEVKESQAQSVLDALNQAHALNLERRDKAEQVKMKESESKAESLLRVLEATRQAQERIEKLCREDAETAVAEIREMIGNKVRKIEEDWQVKQEAADAALDKRIAAERNRQVSALKEQDRAKEEYEQAQAAYLRQCEEECEELSKRLKESGARDGEYRSLLRTAEAGLALGEGAMWEVVRRRGPKDLEDFIHKMAAFDSIMTTSAVSRPAIERARLPLKACRTTTLPHVALVEPAPVAAPVGPETSPQRSYAWSPGAHRREGAAGSSQRRRSKSPAARPVSPSPLGLHRHSVLTMPKLAVTTRSSASPPRTVTTVTSPPPRVTFGAPQYADPEPTEVIG